MTWTRYNPAATESPGSEQSPDQLMRLLEDTRAKADDHWNQLLRARAEMDNLRKRHERELESAHKFAVESFVSELLQVRDSLELGVSAAAAEGVDPASLKQGAELTLKLLTDVMSKFGVEQQNPLGAPFDPSYHQAISTEVSDEAPANTVTRVLQKGYTLNDRVIRPALVTVAQAPFGSEPSASKKGGEDEVTDQPVGGSLDEQA